MSEFNVATTADLLAAAKVAVAGDTIKLASGTYSGVNLKYINPTGMVTITSADPTRPAVFTDMTVNTSSNITVANVVMQVQPTSTAYYDFQVLNASNVNLSNIVFNGTGMTPLVDTTGLNVRNSTGVTVSDSEFKNLVYGVSFLNNTNISVTNSTFHDIRTDGIRGGGNSQVYYGYNFFTNFHPLPEEHADAIQVWTTNTTAPVSDISIVGNVYVRGDTGTTVHGIFIRDGNGLPYQNVTVQDNLILGANFNGLTLDGVASGTVSGNSVIGFSDAESWVRTLNNTSTLKIINNLATKYVTQFDELVDNSVTQSVQDGGLATLQSWSQTRKLPGDFQTWSAVAAEAGLDWASTQQKLVVTELYGTAGDDTLVAGDAILSVYGGDGNDTLQGNGHAHLMGGAGYDRYELKMAGDTISEDAGAGTDWVAAWFDYTLGDNVENLTLMGTATKGIGNAGNNALHGSANADTLNGMAGDDTLWGNDGNDLLFGDLGRDTINGGLGNDRINGGAGKDMLTGGAGYDHFVFDHSAFSTSTEFDEIMDFQRGVDKIDLSAIDAISRTSTNDAFRYIGTKGFSGKGGEIKTVAYNKGTLVMGDVNGDGVADFSILVHNQTKLAAGDFVL